MRTQTGAYENELTGERSTGSDESLDALCGIRDATIIHRFDRELMTSGDFCHRDNLVTPWGAILPVRENDVVGHEECVGV